MPESNNNQNENQRTVEVPAPESGASIAIASEAGGNLKFDFDPGNATASRVDNNLVFQVDGGGTVTLEGFFEVGDQSLPTLTLPDGTVVAATDFFAGSDLDLSTAAGPGAGAPGSGGTNYDDDGGALLGGIDRLGSLGTDYWGRSTEVTEDAEGFTYPSAGIDISIITTLTDPLEPGMVGSFTNVLYEDGQAYQHIYGHKEPGDDGYNDALTPGQLVMVITPSAVTTIDNVALSGFPQGTRIELEDGTVFESTSTDDVLNLSYAQSQGQIFVYPPVDNTDADYTVNWTVTMSSPGYYGVTQSGSFTLVVDAVADKPYVDDADFNAHLGIDKQDHTETRKETQREGEDGTLKVKTGELDSIDFPVSVRFSDLDGSEFHTIEVKGVPSDWSLESTENSLGTYTLINEAPFDSAEAARAALQQSGGGAYATWQDPDTGIVNYIFNVTGQYGDNGYLDSSVTFNPHDWTSSRDDGGKAYDEKQTADIEVTARAEEVNLSGEDVTDLNNLAESTIGKYEVTIVEDTPDFKGRGISILSDESAGVQKGTDEISLKAFYKDHSLQEILNNVEGITPDSRPISVAREGISYDLHSDGANDGLRVGDPSRNAGKADLSFVDKDGDDIGDPTGWFVTGGTEEIFVYYENGVAVGRVGGPEGDVAFVVVPEGTLHNGVNSGSVTFIQYMSLEHRKDGDGSRGSHNEEMKPDLKLNLVLTDDDGDQTSIKVNINVRDDGPEIDLVGKPVKVDETWMRDDGEISASGKFSVDFGADGAADLSIKMLSNDLTSGGKLVQYTHDDNSDPLHPTVTAYIEGEDGEKVTVFTLIVSGPDAKGTYTYTYTQQQPLDHPVAGETQKAHDDPLDIRFTITATDGDGDTATVKAKVTVDDDGPSAGKCDITDIVYEKDLRDGGEIHIDGKLTADFGADGPHADTPVFWDQNAVTAEFDNYNAIIDGEPVGIRVEFSADGTTFTAYAGETDTVVATGTLSLDKDTGKVSYDYTQNEPLQHGEHGLTDIARKLDLKYTIMDGDGDTSSNQLDIIVVDSVSWPTADAFHLDESNYNKDSGVLSGTFVLDNLDYDAPDGIVDVVWNAAWTQKAIDKVTDDIMGTELRVEAHADNPHILYVYNDMNELVITMTLSFNDATGYYEIAYEQYQGLDHPLGGLFHDDKLALPLVVNSVDGDGDATPNLVAVILDDDGPRPLVDSNVALIEGVGNNFVVALYEALAESLDVFKDYWKADGSGELNPDFWNLETLGENVGAAFGDALAEGLKGADASAIMDLVNLILGKQDLLGELPGELLTAGPAAELAKILTDSANAHDHLINALKMAVAQVTDDPRSEHAGDIATGTLDPNYGFDGPAATNPVQWDANGIALLFKLMGVKASGDDGALRVDPDASTATTLVLVGDSGQTVLTLTLNNSDASNPSYTVTQSAGLEHSAGSVEQMLSELLGNGLDSILGQFDSILQGILGDLLPDLSGIPFIEGALQGLLGGLTATDFLNILGFEDAQALVDSLGSGNLLTLPLPIIVTDGDGDTAPGLITVTIRDSVPTLAIGEAVTVAESDLSSGSDFIPGDPHTHTHGQDNNGDKNNTEHEETTAGSFTYKLGFDAGGSVVTITDANGNPIEITQVGDTVQGLYGTLTVTGISDDGNGNVTVTYSYELTDNALHENVQGPNTGQISPEESFTVTVTDGDGDSVSGNMTVTIIDDVPVASNDFDLVEHADTNNDGLADSWVATGNILTGAGTYSDKALTENGVADKFGADERAADGGLQIQARDADTGEALFDGDGNPVWLPVNDDGSVTVQGQYGELKLYGDGCYEYTVDPLKLEAAEPQATQETAWDFTADGKPDGVANSGFTTSGFASSSALNFTDLASLQTWMTGSDKYGIGVAAVTIPRSAATVVTNDGLGNSGTTAKIPVVGNTSLNAGGNEIGNATLFNYGITEGVLIAISPAAQGNVVDMSFGNFDFNLLNTVQEVIKVYLFDDQGNLIGTQTVTAGNDFHYEGATGSKIGAVLVVADNTVTSFTVESISSKVIDNIENWQPSENFDYLLTDSDGDIAKATLHIDVNTKPEVVIDQDTSNLVVHEDGLTGVGTNAGDPDHPITDNTGALKITSGEGIATIEIGSLTLTITGVADDGTVSFTTTGTETVDFGDFGVESITRTVEGGQFVYTVNYKYTLTERTDHSDNDPVTGRHEGLGDDKLVVSVTVTDKSGDPAQGSFTIDIHDDAPIVELLAPGIKHVLTITNHGETEATYKNCFGYYIKNPDGTPKDGVILWANTKETEDTPAGEFQLNGYTEDQVGFFLIPDGTSKNSAVSDMAEVYFKQDESGNWQAFLKEGDIPLTGNGGSNLLLDNAALNVDGKAHVTDNAAPGNQNWEDIAIGGDNDYDDVNISVKWTPTFPEPIITKDSHTDGDPTDEDSVTVNFGKWFNVSDSTSSGADGYGQGTDGPVITYTLTLNDTDSGLTSGGHSISLVLTGDGIVGQITVDGVTTDIFKISINGQNGDVTLTQYEAVDHWGEDADGSSTNNSANLVTLKDGAITFTATATVVDADNDTASDSRSFDISNAFGFRDDVPVIEINSGIDDTAKTWQAHTDGDDVISGLHNGSVIDGSISMTGGADGYGTYSQTSNGETLTGTLSVSDGVTTVLVSAAHTKESPQTLETDAGILKVWMEGKEAKYEFTASNSTGATKNVDITFTIMDGDGDTASDTLTLSVDASKPIITVTGDLKVHEDGLSWGTEANDPAHPITAEGKVEIESVNGLGSITFSADGDELVINVPDDWDGVSPFVPADGANSFAVDLGTVTVTGVVYNGDTDKYEVSFEYKLTSNTTDHSDAKSDHDQLSKGDAAAKAAMPEISVTVTDKAGLSSDAGTITVDVFDDGPELALQHAKTGQYDEHGAWVDDGYVHLDNSYITNGTLTPDYGADRAYGVEDQYILVSFEGQRSVMVNGEPVTNNVASDEPIEVHFDAAGKATVYTGLGLIEFTRNTDGTVSYKYLAKHGLKEDYEEITFTVMDGDKDIAEQSVQIWMDQDVPAGTSYVDEAGLKDLGSHHAGYESNVYAFTVFLPEGTTDFVWDLDVIRGDQSNNILADADGDGVYTQVAWSVDTEGNLVATAEGKTILTVTPPATDANGNIILTQDLQGNWVADMDVTLSYPIKYGDDADNGYNVTGLYFGFDATSPREDGTGDMVTSNAVSVAVFDDAPSAMTKPLEIVESVKAPEDVYLLMDVSTSIDSAELKLGMMALLEMAEKYKADGVEAVFTLALFAQNYKQIGDSQMTVDALIAELKAGLYNNDGSEKTGAQVVSYWRGSGITDGTNYDAILDYTQSMLETAMQDGTYRYYDQKVYFISDGVPNRGEDYTSTSNSFASWKTFIAQHQGTGSGNDQVEVYTIGIGINASGVSVINQVTADPVSGANSHYIAVSTYTDLANALTGLVQQGFTNGNLLGIDIDNNDVRSADATTVLSVAYAGTDYTIPADGSREISITDPISGEVVAKLTVWSNGNYSLSSSVNVDSDVEYNLSYTIRDADGDTSTADIKIVLQDARPEAFNNVASGPDAAYKNGNTFVLDDFGARDDNNWHSAKSSGVTYNTRPNNNTAFTKIDGTTGQTSSSDSFVCIEATARSSNYTALNFDSILKNTVGQTTSQLFGGNAAQSGGMIQQSFDLYAAGEIKFNFILDRSNSSGSAEQAFAVLKDENGVVIWKGLIGASGSSDSHGVCTIPVSVAGHYTLFIGCYDTNVESGNQAPKLYVDKVVFDPAKAADVYHGNVIEDASPYGETDKLADQAVLKTIRFTDMNGNEHVYDVGEGAFASGLLVLTDVFNNGDKLTINDNGNYVYQTANGASFDNVNIEYAIAEPVSGQEDWATLYVRSSDYKFEGATDATYHTDGNDVIIGADGGVTLDGGKGGDVIYGGAGDDTITGGEGNDTLFGGAGDDEIYGGVGNDIIYGGAGDDILFGGAGDDTLFGGDGNDVIIGGLGKDIMTGGAGSDLFVWQSGDLDNVTDVITDFTLREDRLSFADIFGDQAGQNNIPLKAILDALGSGKIDVCATTDTQLSLTVTGDTATQTVEINLAGSLTTDHYNAINDDTDLAAKAALLQQMLTGITGGC